MENTLRMLLTGFGFVFLACFPKEPAQREPEIRKNADGKCLLQDQPKSPPSTP